MNLKACPVPLLATLSDEAKRQGARAAASAINSGDADYYRDNELGAETLVKVYWDDGPYSFPILDILEKEANELWQDTEFRHALLSHLFSAAFRPAALSELS